MEGEGALERLMEGNRRFAEGRARRRECGPERRRRLVAGQRPAAVVVGCADSRVDPTILFDADLGDLFVVGVAGNVVTPEVLGSVELAVAELGAPLCLVLGHSGCGAVGAAVAGSATGAVVHLVEALRPACERVPTQAENRVDRVVRANVRRQVEVLRTSEPVLAARVADERLTVRGGCYDLASGRVELEEG